MTTLNLGRVVGQDGEDGRGIVSITKTATVGLVDTYTITYTDGTTSTFDVTNGQDGTGGQDYTDLTNKPSINDVTLVGNKSLSDLGVQATLTSGTNIKTINNQSLLGSGNITIEGGGASDELIGTLPQTIPSIAGNSYYVLSETNATITTDSGGGTPDSITKDITPSSPNVTVDGDEFTSTAAGGWQLVANIANLLTDGETYCYRTANVEGKPFLKYGGLRIGYEQNGSQYINISVMAGGNIVNPTGTFTYNASNGGAYMAVGGSQSGTIKFQLYQGTTPPEEGGSSEYITIELTANVKYPMDNYKGQTFYSNQEVSLYKLAEGGSTYVLPIATSTNLGGVKAVSKTLDMTEAVGVDEFGQLFVVPNPVETLPLQGKNVLFIGDSLTYGNMGTDPETGEQLYPDKNYPQYFAEVTGCNIYNKGVSGASATSYLANVYSTIDFTIDYDVILVMLGTNLSLADQQGQDYRTIIENLFRDTNGASRIYLVTPPYNNMTSTGHAGYAKNANPVVKAVGQEYCLPVIDTYYEAGLNSSNGALARPIDDLHFNDWGYKRLGTFIANQVLSKYWL